MLLRCTHKPIVYKNTNLIYKKENKQEPKTLLGRKFYSPSSSAFQTYQFNQDGCKMIIYGMFGTKTQEYDIPGSYNDNYTNYGSLHLSENGDILLDGASNEFNEYYDIDDIKVLPNIEESNIQISDDYRFIYITYDTNKANFYLRPKRDENWNNKCFYKDNVLQSKCSIPTIDGRISPNLDSGHWRAIFDIENKNLPSDIIRDAYEIEFDISNDSVYTDDAYKDATLTVEGNSFTFVRESTNGMMVYDNDGNFHAFGNCTSKFSIEGLEPTIIESEASNNRLYKYNVPNVIISGYDLANSKDVTITIKDPIDVTIESWWRIIVDIGKKYLFNRTTHMN